MITECSKECLLYPLVPGSLSSGFVLLASKLSQVLSWRSEMAQRLGVLPVLAEDPGEVPSIHTRQPTAARNYNSRG